MKELEMIRQEILAMLGNAVEIENEVVRAERMHDGKCYAVAYIDLSDDVVKRASEFNDFQDRILGNDFFNSSGDLRWNKYLYILAGPNSVKHSDFQTAKTLIESDKDYARKRVVTESELQSLLGSTKHFTLSTSEKEYNVVGEWEKRLILAGLDELLDRPTRTEVLQRIGTHTAKREAINNKSSSLSSKDNMLSKKWLASISVDGFRPVHDGKSYNFGQVNLIIGPNGVGKTSLLEAIEYFYCGSNRRPGNAVPPKISGILAGEVEPLQAPTEAGRIRARCFNWYNRDERLTRAILGSFTRYNFLDTDAAFRISTELEPTAIPEDLSRLLVGADASTIWDYFAKILPEIENAHERAKTRSGELQFKLEIAQKELLELENRPSNGKSLTDAFRSSLDTLRWKGGRESHPLTTSGEIDELMKAFGNLQAIMTSGPMAINLNAIYSRREQINAAINEVQKIESERENFLIRVKQLDDKLVIQSRISQNLDRWLTYVSSGFSSAYSKFIDTKAAADNALQGLGIYATGDVVEVTKEYTNMQLDSALADATNKVLSSQARVAELESLVDSFDKAASARAQAALQLQTAVEKMLASGHPKDDCPVCRAKYSPDHLANLISKISVLEEQPGELTLVANQLNDAKQSLGHFQSGLNYFQYLQRVAVTINLPPNVLCGLIPSKIIELRKLLANANEEFNRASQDWQRLENSGLTINEHDQLKAALSTLFQDSQSALDANEIQMVSEQHTKASDETKRSLDQNKESLKLLSEQIVHISNATILNGWNTQSVPGDGLQSLVVMSNEIASVEKQIDALLESINVGSDASLTELHVQVVTAIRMHSEALKAVTLENSAFANILNLKEQIKKLNDQLEESSARAKNYQEAGETLLLIQKETSLESATQETLNLIGTQINEIFSRIHSPNEYEYVGTEGVLLQTAVNHDRRNLEQVSTGQRAAFALSVFLAMNRSAVSAPPVVLIDDPIAHIDDLNALSFMDYLRDMSVNSNRQIFFATADTRIASLFSRKFSFLGDSFRTISLLNKSISNLSVT